MSSSFESTNPSSENHSRFTGLGEVYNLVSGQAALALNGLRQAVTQTRINRLNKASDKREHAALVAHGPKSDLEKDIGRIKAVGLEDFKQELTEGIMDALAPYSEALAHEATAPHQFSADIEAKQQARQKTIQALASTDSLIEVLYGSGGSNRQVAVQLTDTISGLELKHENPEVQKRLQQRLGGKTVLESIQTQKDLQEVDFQKAKVKYQKPNSEDTTPYIPRKSKRRVRQQIRLQEELRSIRDKHLPELKAGWGGNIGSKEFKEFIAEEVGRAGTSARRKNHALEAYKDFRNLSNRAEYLEARIYRMRHGETRGDIRNRERKMRKKAKLEAHLGELSTRKAGARQKVEHTRTARRTRPTT